MPDSSLFSRTIAAERSAPERHLHGLIERTCGCRASLPADVQMLRHERARKSAGAREPVRGPVRGRGVRNGASDDRDGCGDGGNEGSPPLEKRAGSGERLALLCTQPSEMPPLLCEAADLSPRRRDEFAAPQRIEAHRSTANRVCSGTADRGASQRIVTDRQKVMSCRLLVCCAASQHTVACGAVLRRMGLRHVVSCVVKCHTLLAQARPGEAGHRARCTAARCVFVRNRARPARFHQPAAEAPAGCALQGTS